MRYRDNIKNMEVNMIEDNKSLLIGIAGPSGSGKSLLVRNLVSVLKHPGPSILREDHYYHRLDHIPFRERVYRNYDHPDAFDHKLMEQHIDSLLAQQTIESPIYDFTQHTRSQDTLTVTPSKVILIDGILLLATPSIREKLDIAIFIDTPLDICLIRRVGRDLKERGRDFDSIIDQYEKTVRPMYFQHVKPSKKNADIVVTGGGENWIAIDMIKSRIEQCMT